MLDRAAIQRTTKRKKAVAALRVGVNGVVHSQKVCGAKSRIGVRQCYLQRLVCPDRAGK